MTDGTVEPVDISETEAVKSSVSLSLVAFGYDEEELIEGFLAKAVALLERTVPDFEIIFVNDGSTDRTGALADAFAATEPRVKVLHNEHNMNVALSFRRGVTAATKDVLTWQTIDWSYDIQYLDIYLELLRHYDVVLGVRPVPSRIFSSVPFLRSIHRMRWRSDNLMRAVQSLTYYYLIRALFGLSFHDTQNVHFYHTRELQALEFESNSVFLGIEMLTKMLMAGKTFIEVPVPFIPRQAGTAKGNRFSTIFSTFRDVVSEWLRWGRKARTQLKNTCRQQVWRLTEPTALEPEVIRLVAPLFKLYR